MKWKALVAFAVLLASPLAEARTRPHAGRRGGAPRVTLQELRAALVSPSAGLGSGSGEDLHARLLRDGLAPAPGAGTPLRAVLPPAVLTALEEAAARQDAPPSRTDGLSWRDLRPVDESGRKILPLAMGRF